MLTPPFWLSPHFHGSELPIMNSMAGAGCKWTETGRSRLPGENRWADTIIISVPIALVPALSESFGRQRSINLRQESILTREEF